MKRLLGCAVMAMLVGCGPGAKIGGGKQGAAEALYAASRPTRASADQGSSATGLGTLDWTCPLGGSASLVGAGLSIDVGGGGASLGERITLGFKGCGLATSDAGTALYDGQLDLTQQLTAGASAVSVSQRLSGKVSVHGAFDDFVQADVTQTIDATALGGTGAVSMTLKGTVTDSSGTYTFDESVSVTAGQITAQLATK